MTVEIGSRATWRGRRVVVTEPYPFTRVRWWRVRVGESRDGTGLVVPEPSLEEVEPPPAFQVGDRIRTVMGRAGVVEEVGVVDGRTRYGVRFRHPLDEKVERGGPGLTWVGPEIINTTGATNDAADED